MVKELISRGLEVKCQQELFVYYKGSKLDTNYRIDLIVNQQVIVELKAVSQIDPIHRAQLLTYLKLSNIKTGLLLNFNVPVMKDGIRRVMC
jgi:GxxExxY protein